jgi:hypothetical protein
LKKNLLFISILITSAGYCQQKEFVITEYGAKPGGMINTVAIQKAIDEAEAAGGGQVVFPVGRFVTGTIELKSNVHLRIEKGAMLEGSDKRKDYDGAGHLALINSVRQHNISITGEGIIDGKGRELIKDVFKRLEEGTLTDPDWKIKRPSERNRTSLIYFEDCDNIKVKGVSFKDATTWVTHYERCRNVTIDSIRIESTAYWNNDGIDLVDCKNVRITNSFINSADDGICLKSARKDDYCDSVYVENCTIRSSASAFKLGTGSRGGFKNITVRGLIVYDTYRSAIALEAVDGGFLENIDIRNITATNTGNAIFIRSAHRNNDSAYSMIRNIYIRDVKVEVPGGKPDKGYEMEGPMLKYPPGITPSTERLMSISPWNHSTKEPGVIIYPHNVFPSSISGLPGHFIENVTLENIEVTYEGGANKALNYFPLNSFQMVTEAENDYPEFSMFGEVPAWGFYIRHVKGLNLKNIRLINKKNDYRTAVLVNDAEDIRLETISVKGPVPNPVLFINAARSLTLKNIEVTGDRSKAIKIIKTASN